MRVNDLLGRREPLRVFGTVLRRWPWLLSAAALVVLAGGGAAQAQVSLPVKIAPPARKVEIQPPRPSDFHSWMPGHWRWIGGTWVWARGKWLESPAPGTYWQPGFWEPRPYGYVWVPGGWVTASP